MWHHNSLVGLWMQPRKTRQLLRHPGSLSRALRRAYTFRISVKVLSVQCCCPTREESLALHLPPDRRAWVRETLLQCRGKNRVYARTVVPLHSATGGNRILLKGEKKPVGRLLFRATDGRRKWVSYQLMAGHLNIHTAAAKTIALRGTRKRSLAIRRSLFHLRHKPLLITEYFLPARAE